MNGAFPLLDLDACRLRQERLLRRLAEQVADGRLVLPLKLSIASRLIGAWRDGRLTVQGAPGEM